MRADNEGPGPAPSGGPVTTCRGSVPTEVTLRRLIMLVGHESLLRSEPRLTRPLIMMWTWARDTRDTRHRSRHTSWPTSQPPPLRDTVSRGNQTSSQAAARIRAEFPCSWLQHGLGKHSLAVVGCCGPSSQQDLSFSPRLPAQHKMDPAGQKPF